ncbi:methyltransferase domain-containing protein [Undibacterium fentianense]|uniref:SAM-dependent methyltransferase n=1 Tax=Undibacterium fentianense TaxID=2828728 RepID=A0A941IFT4_9BURK|nr:methyltransferase domain-containing protein [Undibacterium fentianense]MBR7801061.1 SAM-dependent methyltransferase [Undibacterium fentianense]
MTVSFLNRDPTRPEFWCERFEQGFVPWDSGTVPKAVQDFVFSQNGRCETNSNCLIPGCGNAYELGFLSDAGWQVTAIDFSEVAVAKAKTRLRPWADRILQRDFFDYTPDFVLSAIYERAFFCALPPGMRPAIVARWAELLPAGGKLFGFFLLDETENAVNKGPPFRTSTKEFYALMQEHFFQLEDTEVSDSLPIFGGHERWQVWQRQ